MATKTERILDLLPRTFRAGPVGSPLGALTGTFGTELQQAENALAALMRAHWADHADRGAPGIDDLARFAALYGLAPMDGDGVEEFRRRLKLWVRIILDGPASVRNLLRATSAILGVEIDDSDEAFDPWWLRPGPGLVTRERSRSDAATLVLGVDAAEAAGADAAAAAITGRIVLATTVDLTGGSTLSIALDGAAPVVTDLATGAADPAAIPVEDVTAAINSALGPDVASIAGGRLRLTSPTFGDASSVSIADVAEDAAPSLLGLGPRSRTGTAARAAAFTSPVDLAGGADLSEARYLRLDVDGTLAEIDCAGGAPGVVALDVVRDAINAEFPSAVASHDGSRLTLRSPTTGSGSRIAFGRAAAQDATTVLFGVPPSVVVGAEEAPPTLTGSRNLSRGADLSERSLLVLEIDGGAPVTIDCAGAEPASTQLPELVATINAAAGAGTARHNGRNLILSGAVTGPAGTLVLGFAGPEDASETLLGLAPRQATGSDAVSARVEGRPVLADPVNLWGRSKLSLALDRAHPVLIDLAAGAADRAAVTGPEIAAAINISIGQTVASATGGALVLESQSSGAAGHVAVRPVEIERRRNFVSRVPIAGDAAMQILGAPSADASGEPAAPAIIAGTRNLSRGADLRAARFLRIAVDGAAPVDIDCAGPRPRATTIAEVTGNINGTLSATVASDEAGRLTLTSPSTGASSRLELSAPRATDAAEALLGLAAADVRGAPASRPAFVGLVDLSGGVDLSTASHLRLAVDGGPPVEIDCAGPTPEATLPAEIAIRINGAMNVNIASHDGARVTLTTPLDGGGALLKILAPASADATRAILGIDPGRAYRGADAAPARIAGLPDLGAGADLSVARFLRLSVDGAEAAEIDVAAEADDPANVPLATVVDTIAAAVGATVASDESGRLMLTSPTSGLSSRLVVEAASSGDAREALLGTVADVAEGTPARPAEINGRVDVTAGVDLSERAILPIVTSSRSGQVSLAGAIPEATSAEEIVAAINASGLASADLTADGRLRLSAPDQDPERLSVPALRYFELYEYPPAERRLTQGVQHGDRLRLGNPGAAASDVRLEIRTALGVDAPGVVSIARGWEVRFLGPLHPGETMTLAADTGGGIRARLGNSDGATAPVPPGRVFIAPLTPYLRAEEGVARRAAPGPDGRRQIALSAGAAPERVVLTQRGGTRGDSVSIAPAATVPASGAAVLAGRLDVQNGVALLLDDDDAPIARIAGGAPPSAMPGSIVAIKGTVSDATRPPTITPERSFPSLDITIERRRADGSLERRMTLDGVVLATAVEVGHLSLDQRLAAEPGPLMRSETRLAADALRLERGGGEWIFVEADASRFNAAYFGAARFAGPPRFGRGIFDASRLAEEPRAAVTPVVAGPPPAGPVLSDVTLSWQAATPGSARINLPRDLPRRFGARFNEDRFALAGDAPLELSGIVFEPPSDDDFITTRITAESSVALLLAAETVATVPIGFAAVSVPFFTPVELAGGRSDQAAQLFLDAPGLAGFIRLSAAAPGRFGNDISVVVCAADPGRYDLLIAFAGARFDNARAAVTGPELTGRTDDLIAPGPRGVLHLKAGGVAIEVTRDGLPLSGRTDH